MCFGHSVLHLHSVGRARKEPSLVSKPLSDSDQVKCCLCRSHVIQGPCIPVRQPLQVPVLEYVAQCAFAFFSYESSVINDRPGATVDCLIERLMVAGVLVKPQMFIRKQGKHALTRSGRCWKWARGMELLQHLEMKDENGVPIVDYVDTEYLRFAIAVVDDGHTECGHILGRLHLSALLAILNSDSCRAAIRR